jgi:hypothetical protein
MLMAGALGVLSVFLAAATTEVEEYVNGGTLGVLSVVRQQPPPKMKKMLMVSSLGHAVGISSSGHYRS